MTDKIHPLLMGRRVMVRRRAFAGLGGPAARSGATDGAFPSPDGSPGSLVYPYGERSPIYGDSGPNGGGGLLSVTNPPIIDAPIPAPPIDTGTTADGLSVPFGASVVPWQNPTTLQSIPVVAAQPANIPVLSLNLKRNLLLIQNNSTATGAGNTAPTFYIGFNSQAQVGLSLALAPGGGGVLYDVICPRDSVYITIAGGVGVFTVAGTVQQGTYAPL